MPNLRKQTPYLQLGNTIVIDPGSALAFLSQITTGSATDGDQEDAQSVLDRKLEESGVLVKSTSDPTFSATSALFHYNTSSNTLFVKTASAYDALIKEADVVGHGTNNIGASATSPWIYVNTADDKFFVKERTGSSGSYQYHYTGPFFEGSYESRIIYSAAATPATPVIGWNAANANFNISGGDWGLDTVSPKWFRIISLPKNSNTAAVSPLIRIGNPTASDISVNASGFDGNLATTDTDLQKVAQKLDDLVVSGGGGGTDDQTAAEVSVDAAGFNGNLTTTDNTVQKVAQKLDDLVITDDQTAAEVSVAAAGFNGNLTTTDNTVQKVAQKLDDLVVTDDQTAAEVSVAATGFDGILASTDNDVQKVAQKLDDLTASNIPVTATGFNGNLATTDNTVQKVAQKLDDLSIGSGTDDQTAAEVTVDTTGFDGNLATTDNTVQKVAQKFDDFEEAVAAYEQKEEFSTATVNSSTRVTVATITIEDELRSEGAIEQGYPIAITVSAQINGTIAAATTGNLYLANSTGNNPTIYGSVKLDQNNADNSFTNFKAVIPIESDVPTSSNVPSGSIYVMLERTSDSGTISVDNGIVYLERDIKNQLLDVHADRFDFNTGIRYTDELTSAQASTYTLSVNVPQHILDQRTNEGASIRVVAKANVARQTANNVNVTFQIRDQVGALFSPTEDISYDITTNGYRNIVQNFTLPAGKTGIQLTLVKDNSNTNVNFNYFDGFFQVIESNAFIANEILTDTSGDDWTGPLSNTDVNVQLALESLAQADQTAADVSVDASGFNGNLATTDVDVQKVAQKLDDLVVTDDQTAAEVSVDASGFNGNLATTDNTVQKVAQKLDDIVINDDQTAAEVSVDASGFNGNLTTTDNTVQKVAQKFNDFEEIEGYQQKVEFSNTSSNQNDRVTVASIGIDTALRSEAALEQGYPIAVTVSAQINGTIPAGTEGDLYLANNTGTEPIIYGSVKLDQNNADNSFVNFKAAIPIESDVPTSSNVPERIHLMLHRTASTGTISIDNGIVYLERDLKNQLLDVHADRFNFNTGIRYTNELTSAEANTAVLSVNVPQHILARRTNEGATIRVVAKANVARQTANNVNVTFQIRDQVGALFSPTEDISYDITTNGYRNIVQNFTLPAGKTGIQLTLVKDNSNTNVNFNYFDGFFQVIESSAFIASEILTDTSAGNWRAPLTTNEVNVQLALEKLATDTTSAAEISVDASGFGSDGALTTADTNVQLVASKLNDLEASDVPVTATGFDGILATTDDTVQEVAQKLDDLTAANVPVDASSFGNTGVLISTDDTVQKVAQKLEDLDAADIPVTATGFDGNLTSSDTTVQQVAQKVDDLDVSSGGIAVDNAEFSNSTDSLGGLKQPLPSGISRTGLEATPTTVQEAFVKSDYLLQSAYNPYQYTQVLDHGSSNTSFAISGTNNIISNTINIPSEIANIVKLNTNLLVRLRIKVSTIGSGFEGTVRLVNHNNSNQITGTFDNDFTDADLDANDYITIEELIPNGQIGEDSTVNPNSFRIQFAGQGSNTANITLTEGFVSVIPTRHSNDQPPEPAAWLESVIWTAGATTTARLTNNTLQTLLTGHTFGDYDLLQFNFDNGNNAGMLFPMVVFSSQFRNSASFGTIMFSDYYGYNVKPEGSGDNQFRFLWNGGGTKGLRRIIGVNLRLV